MSYEFYRVDEFEKETLPFNLLYITRSKYDKDWLSTTHSHHFTELFYIVSGKGSFVLPDHEVPVKENDLVIINPNVEHTEKSNSKGSLEYIAIGIEGISFSIPEDKRETELGLFTYRGDQKNILFYLNRLIDEAQEESVYYEAICRNIIEILIYKLRREKNISVENKKSHRMNQSVALVKQYINQNYRHSITLDKLAKIGNINKYYLAHIFKDNIGNSPIGYLNQVRITGAQTMLEITDYTIGEIARFNGFSSQSFFTQVFKRETNQTPSEYRKNSVHNSPQEKS